MATASVAFKSREDDRKQQELEEARKAGLAPAEVDENGKEINPYIPKYISSAPWYLNSKRPSLEHQRIKKVEPFNLTNSSMAEVQKLFLLTTTGPLHVKNKKIENLQLDYDGKQDNWNACNPEGYIPF
ncbi:Pre-mRNA-splicing factor SLU7-A like [Actinidia chinensis var. chinensis]|uniref:Pre-mRNA-splicing factor SLU7 n=1 Tax=Actinidia chinensis var. chinensis TaxID=1590841 RepID=A0A2R6P358_ACTCC|nr:Pre-mRNA-splicing factor SLU7-A like [Actinidia chinensis var. chinensis]